jgi:hypothetical protein
MTTKRKKRPVSKTTEHRHRDGDTMVLVTVETRPAVIEFAAIREAVEVEPDPSFRSEAPWERCDGYKHELRDLNHDREIHREACIYHDGRRRVLDVPFDDTLFNWYRKHGASRQTAREAVARSRQHAIKQLTQWYQYGWEWWHVHCDFLDFTAAVGGVDDFAYASGACADDMAYEIAGELVEAGYTVNGLPTEAERRAEYLDNRRESLKHNVRIGTWQ